MPRYHFNVHDHLSPPDTEGWELADVFAAREEAVRLSGEILRDCAGAFWKDREWKLSVTDGDGTALFTLVFAAVEGSFDLRQALERSELIR